MADIYDFIPRELMILDFANSKITRTAAPHDLFTEYPYVVHWLRHLDVLNDEQASSLLMAAEEHPDRAQTALKQINDLRDACFGLFTAAARKKPLGAEHLAVLNRHLQEALGQRRLAAAESEIARWEWDLPAASLDWMRYPLALAAAELLTSDQAGRIRECDGCYWLFLDTSRNGKRRWCNMKICGNREKARRHYERTRKKPAAEQ